MVKTIFISTFLCILVACAYQRPPVVMDPQSPRIVIKEVPVGEPRLKSEKEELFETSYVYPDLTRGYIENQAFPYVPKVFLIKDAQKIVLVGPETGPPEFNTKEIREFNLPPGKHVLHIERWQHSSAYGGWKKISKVEVVKVSVAQFKSGDWIDWKDNYYGWSITIYDNHTAVSSGYRQ